MLEMPMNSTKRQDGFQVKGKSANSFERISRLNFPSDYNLGDKGEFSRTQSASTKADLHQHKIDYDICRPQAMPRDPNASLPLEIISNHNL